jgi:hypothetical protein
MPSNVLFLTGAPRSSSLEWDPSGLLESFTAPVARFAHIQDSNDDLISYSVTPMELRHASWRSLDFDRRHLATGCSQVYGLLDEYQNSAVFLTISDSSSAYSDLDDANFQSESNPRSWSGSVKENLPQYYEHSFAAHEEIASSQVNVGLSGQHVAIPSLVHMRIFNTNESSLGTTLLSPSSVLDSAMTPPRLSVPDGGHLCDLKDIPGAKYLESIQPQTVTFNLIVGVISIMPFRKIKTRRGGDVGIIELLVGDETRSGFRVNFWLPTDVHEGNWEGGDGSSGKVLSGIRPQDIILLRNVAAACFRGQAYGQSIRKDMTKVHLLFRNRVDRTDIGGCYTVTDLEDGQDEQTQIAKVSQVRNWVLRFVAPAKLATTTKGKVNLLKEVLPPDTQ